MDRVFLDANVLFAAAWRPNGALYRLWELDDAELLSSSYAVVLVLPPAEFPSLIPRE